MKRSAVAGLIVGFLVGLLFLTACQKRPGTSGPSLVVWHWMTDREEAFLEMARRYKEQTGVTVEFQLFAPSDTYAQKVRVGAQTNSLPDIYGILDEARVAASFIEAGHVENLTVALGEGPGSWKETFFDAALETGQFKKDNIYHVPAGYYGIPLDMTNIPMIYNKKLFRQAGLDPSKPPKTWDEFLTVGSKLKKVGVTGFVSGWAEKWLIYSFATDLAHNLMGADKVMESFRGNVPYTDPQWVQVFEAFEKMQKAGFADPSLVTLDNKSAEQAFSSERSGMTFNGSWAVNVFASMNPELDYAPFYPPALNMKNPRYVWGGAGSIFYINAKSPQKDKALTFLRWLTSREQASYLVNATKNLPSVKGLSDKSIFPRLKPFASIIEHTIHPNRFPASEDPRVQELISKGIQSILIGEKTPVQIAGDVQHLKAKLSALK
ncbi:MAG: extracellular solute-binding protein [Elusimicrobia bacterium]|nr:extracellular solute-binding protein [Candidatus Obscuribacterium magneticum]